MKQKNPDHIFVVDWYMPKEGINNGKDENISEPENPEKE